MTPRRLTEAELAEIERYIYTGDQGDQETGRWLRDRGWEKLSTEIAASWAARDILENQVAYLKGEVARLLNEAKGLEGRIALGHRIWTRADDRANLAEAERDAALEARDEARDWAFQVGAALKVALTQSAIEENFQEPDWRARCAALLEVQTETPHEPDTHAGSE